MFKNRVFVSCLMNKLCFDYDEDGVRSGYIDGVFSNVARDILASQGLDLISGEVNSLIRIKSKKQSRVNKHGNIVSAGVGYVPGVGRFVFPNFLELFDYDTAVRCQSGSARGEYYLNQNQVRKLINNSVRVPNDFPGFFLPGDLEKREMARVFWGDYGKKYAETFVQDKYRVYIDRQDFVDEHKFSYANIFYWQSPNLNSTLCGVGWIFGNMLRVRGASIERGDDVACGMNESG